jgi:hypothetical protein
MEEYNIVPKLLKETTSLEGPASSWLSPSAWHKLHLLAGLPAFSGLIEAVTGEESEAWQAYKEAVAPHPGDLPAPFDDKPAFQRLLVLTCLRYRPI